MDVLTTFPYAMDEGCFDPMSPNFYLPCEFSVSSVTRKCVQFSTATEYIFDVAYGGSALPSNSGPAIGLEATHKEILTVDVKDKLGRVDKFNPLERVALLKNKYSLNDIVSFCEEANNIRESRAREVEVVHRKRRGGAKTNETKTKRRVIGE